MFDSPYLTPVVKERKSVSNPKQRKDTEKSTLNKKSKGFNPSEGKYFKQKHVRPLFKAPIEYQQSQTEFFTQEQRDIVDEK